LKRLWEAYLVSSELSVVSENKTAGDIELDTKVRKLIAEFDEFMNDDFNTAKVLANMFELVPVINGIKDKHIPANALSSETTLLLKQQLKVYLEDIFGLQAINASADNSKLDGVMQLLINIRKEARAKKDFQTSDKIRNELAGLGVQLKDEKDGSVSWSMN
jgi:cysteinyl-tRNA synthetase